MSKRQRFVLYIGAFLFGSLLAFALPGCKDIRPRTVSDIAHDACLLVMAERAEVKADAEKQGISPLDVARTLCALNDVVAPFLSAQQDAGDDAVAAAQKVGALKR